MIDAPSQLEHELDDVGVALCLMPAGLDMRGRAEWLRDACRTLDLATAGREDVLVGAFMGAELGPAFADRELAFVAFREDLDEDAWRKAMLVGN